MQSNNLAFVIAAAKSSRHPIAKAVQASVEVGAVVPSKLRSELADAGYTVNDDQASMAEYGFKSTKFLQRVIVTDKKGVIVAMGAAADPDEAILAAMLGWFRENATPGAAVPAGFAVAPGSRTDA